jgi:hypothetical protein
LLNVCVLLQSALQPYRFNVSVSFPAVCANNSDDGLCVVSRDVATGQLVGGGSNFTFTLWGANLRGPDGAVLVVIRMLNIYPPFCATPPLHSLIGPGIEQIQCAINGSALANETFDFVVHTNGGPLVVRTNWSKLCVYK